MFMAIDLWTSIFLLVVACFSFTPSTTVYIHFVMTTFSESTISFFLYHYRLLCIKFNLSQVICLSGNPFLLLFLIFLVESAVVAKQCFYCQSNSHFKVVLGIDRPRGITSCNRGAKLRPTSPFTSFFFSLDSKVNILSSQLLWNWKTLGVPT